MCQPRDPMPHLFSPNGSREKAVHGGCVETFKCTRTHSLTLWKYNHLHVQYIHLFPCALCLAHKHTATTHERTHTPAHTCMPLTQTHRHKPHNKSQTLADHTALSCGENKGYSYPSQWEVCTANSPSPSLPLLSPQLFITDNLHSQTFHFPAIVRFLIIFISP